MYISGLSTPFASIGSAMFVLCSSGPFIFARFNRSTALVFDLFTLTSSTGFAVSISDSSVLFAFTGSTRSTRSVSGSFALFVLY